MSINAKQLGREFIIPECECMDCEKLEARVKELEADLADILDHRHRKDGTLQMILEQIVEEGVL